MKYFLVIVLAAVVFLSCKKSDGGTTHVLFYNGSWSVPAITATWNGSAIITTPVSQGQSTGTVDNPYLPVPAGTNLVTVNSGAAVLFSKNVYANPATGNSLLFYDTSITAPSTVQTIQLTDDLSLPDTAQIKFRFINASPDTAATTDLWLVHGTTDSALIKTASFIGKDAPGSTVQVFEAAIKYHGETYTIKAKKSGTQNVLASVSNAVFVVKGIYSFVLSGFSTGTGSSAFKLSVLHHVP